MKKCMICKVVVLLGGLGALNWLLVAFVNLNLVTKILGEGTLPSKVVYGLIGVAGAILLVSLIKPCPCCKTAT